MARSEEKVGRMETIEDKLGRATNYLHDIKVLTPLPLTPHPELQIIKKIQ